MSCTLSTERSGVGRRIVPVKARTLVMMPRTALTTITASRRTDITGWSFAPSTKRSKRVLGVSLIGLLLRRAAHPSKSKLHIQRKAKPGCPVPAKRGLKRGTRQNHQGSCNPGTGSSSVKTSGSRASPYSLASRRATFPSKYQRLTSEYSDVYTCASRPTW